MNNGTIHIEGFANQLDICASLSDNYALDVNFPFEEEGTEVIPNVFIRFYYSDKKESLDAVIEKHLKKIFGSMQLAGSDYGYSEYTVEGFNVTNAEVGGHNIQKIISSFGDKFLHILIDGISTSAYSEIKL